MSPAVIASGSFLRRFVQDLQPTPRKTLPFGTNPHYFSPMAQLNQVFRRHLAKYKDFAHQRIDTSVRHFVFHTWGDWGTVCTPPRSANAHWPVRLVSSSQAYVRASHATKMASQIARKVACVTGAIGYLCWPQCVAVFSIILWLVLAWILDTQTSCF